MNCRECGVDVDPSEQQVNATVDQILETSLQDAQKIRRRVSSLRPLQRSTLLTSQVGAIRTSIGMLARQHLRGDLH
jgi:hypothetical protein